MDAMQANRAQRFAQGYNILTGVVRDPPTFWMISDSWVSVKLETICGESVNGYCNIKKSQPST